ncbi:MAG: hypothetical protein IJX05_04935 [Clostridia bacterium]|nr:hypothetical protein [Clostridia bacterium]
MIYSASYVRLAKSTQAYKTLSKAFAEGKESHAYLLSSPDILLSECVAAAVACGGACSACLDCAKCKRILSEKCSDFVTYDKLTASEAEEIVSSCLYAPSELERKFFVVNASVGNETGQNRLLKTLEEAPRGVVFFIIAPSESSVLPTVASRCEQLLAYLEREVEGDDFSPYYNLARYGAKNSLTLFDRLIKPAGANLLSHAIRAVVLLSENRRLEAVELFPSKRDELAEFLGYVELVFGDVMKRACGRDVNTYGLYDADRLANIFGERVPRILAEVRRAVRRTPSGNLTSIADTFAVNVTEVL